MARVDAGHGVALAPPAPGLRVAGPVPPREMFYAGPHRRALWPRGVPAPAVAADGPGEPRLVVTPAPPVGRGGPVAGGPTRHVGDRLGPWAGDRRPPLAPPVLLRLPRPVLGAVTTQVALPPRVGPDDGHARRPTVSPFHVGRLGGVAFRRGRVDVPRPAKPRPDEGRPRPRRVAVPVVPLVKGAPVVGLVVGVEGRTGGLRPRPGRPVHPAGLALYADVAPGRPVTGLPGLLGAGRTRHATGVGPRPRPVTAT